MWQRFTERARKAVFFAQIEAQNHGERHVGTQHLLLGLIREGDSIAARILERLGASPDTIRTEVERQTGPGEPGRGSEMTLSPRAKRVIDLAYDEARNLINNYIGTEHLLLGLIREGEGAAAKVLAKLNVDLDQARRQVIELQDAAGVTRDHESFLAPRQRQLPTAPFAGVASSFVLVERLNTQVGTVAIACLSASPALATILSLKGLDPFEVIDRMETAVAKRSVENEGLEPTLARVFHYASLMQAEAQAPSLDPGFVTLAAWTLDARLAAAAKVTGVQIIELTQALVAELIKAHSQEAE